MIGPWYFLLDLGLWLMAAVTIRWAWPKMGFCWRLSAIFTAGAVMLLQIFNEFLSFNIFKAWSFSFEHNRLIGLELFGAPLEEYLFWFAFAWFLPFLYSGWVAWYAEHDIQQGLPSGVRTHE